jgi:D-alanyl-D-alanine dipeptidase
MKILIAISVASAAACARPAPVVPAPTQAGAPIEAPSRWLGLLGEYDTPLGMRVILEDNMQVIVADTNGHRATIHEQTSSDFTINLDDARRLLGGNASLLVFQRDVSGHALGATLGDLHINRREIEPAAGATQLRVTPVRPVEQVRAEALAASPPRETGNFRAPDLVELTKLDPSIKLEIRYATTNNFLGTKFYDEARAFMQRPAAEAVVRANRALAPLGFGLLIHDAYRPWYVTKMFWDATPPDRRWMVADPSQGSRHNRGEAVDLTLYDLSTGKPVQMPSTYDESTDRAYADYPGGTSLQRWRRALLRRAMEKEGFTVNPTEWWHFDYKDWRQYPIGNVAFDKVH